MVLPFFGSYFLFVLGNNALVQFIEFLFDIQPKFRNHFENFFSQMTTNQIFSFLFIIQTSELHKLAMLTLICRETLTRLSPVIYYMNQRVAQTCHVNSYLQRNNKWPNYIMTQEETPPVVQKLQGTWPLPCALQASKKFYRITGHQASNRFYRIMGH